MQRINQAIFIIDLLGIKTSCFYYMVHKSVRRIVLI